ncbi:Uncharacterised protein [Salmonella enterica subsp. salamae]|uniref:Uncharacterized protein n=1 Tax=Salmonella enterica TaxID=28901 RepID=A0A379QYR8_SALER|nr:hypothetical protein [Salmonella enterica]ECC9556585.1 hypothetical protein [Salmonella enterica subsp. salamae]EBQ2950657.1 hypothetical protein [Salmonella enterica]EDV1420806.1 hypothetical protein [Salmonella enterica subsp. salamae]MIV63382.1 hypothetical protein [Salmonella enterica]
MKLEEAFSIELRRLVSADDADRAFNKLITSKHMFKCPDPKCNAQVTCANLDKPKSFRKRDPYFIFVSEHIDGCPIGENIFQELRKIKNGMKDPEALSYINDDVIELDLSSSSRKVFKNDNEENEKSDSTSFKRNQQKSLDEDTDHKRYSRKRLSGLVEAFLAGEERFVETVDGRIHIKELFIPISTKKDISLLPDEPKIYYGKAWINKIKNFFQVKFNSEMTYGELTCKPTFFIPASLIDDESNLVRTSRVNLDKLASSKPSIPLNMFIFSNVPPIKSNKGNHINFLLSDMTHIYFKQNNK